MIQATIPLPPVMCYENPWLLDTPEKVAWANRHRDKWEREWRFGDHCYYRPADAPDGRVTLTCTIPLPPADLSPNARVHWAKRAKATKAHRFAAFVQFAAAKREAKWRHMRPVIVDIEYRYCKAAKGYKPLDAQNALSSLKASFDALADAGIVPNDSARWLTLGKVELLTRAADPRVKALGAGVTFTIREYP